MRPYITPKVAIYLKYIKRNLLTEITAFSFIAARGADATDSGLGNRGSNLGSHIILNAYWASIRDRVSKTGESTRKI